MNNIYDSNIIIVNIYAIFISEKNMSIEEWQYFRDKTEEAPQLALGYGYFKFTFLEGRCFLKLIC